MPMKKYEIKCVIKAPDTVSFEQVKAYVRFMCGDIGKLPNDNPLYDTSFDAVFGTFEIKAVE